jgi:hypothetical protein
MFDTEPISVLFKKHVASNMLRFKEDNGTQRYELEYNFNTLN